MYTLEDSAPSGLSLFDFPAPAGRVTAGAFDDAIETNPVPLFMLSRELNAARARGPRLEYWEATDQAKKAGVKVSVPDDGISQEALGILIERRRDEAARSVLFARREGVPAAVGMFSAGLAGAFMDPVNAAAGYIPILSGTRYAAALERATTVGGRMAVRGGVGAAEGLVGAALVEAPTLALRRELQDEYGLYDSLANVAFGTFASSGLRMVGGAARDRWKGLQAARQEDFLRSVEPSEWAAVRQAHEQSLETGMNADLEGGFARGGGIPDEMASAFAGQRAAAERLKVTDEVISRMRGRMSDAEIKRFVDAEERFRAEAAAPGADDRKLLDAAGIAERKFREMDLAEVRDRLARGEGLIIVPGNERETAAAISDETHAQALKVAVSQAIEGRRIDVEPVVRQDAAFGPQRMGADEVRRRAASNMAPEAKVGADAAASKRADETIKETGAPAAKRGGAEPPPPRGSSRAEAAGVTASEKRLAEAQALLAETKAANDAAYKEAGLEPPKPRDEDFSKKAEDYDKAWKAIADCARGKGI